MTMKRMKSIYRTSWGVLLCLLLLFTLVACQGNDAPAPEPMPQEKEMRILWDVQSVSMVEGRALIEDNADLKEACTEGSGNKAIGIWSAYERNGEVTKNVLGEDGDVSLVYKVNTQSN